MKVMGRNKLTFPVRFWWVSVSLRTTNFPRILLEPQLLRISLRFDYWNNTRGHSFHILIQLAGDVHVRNRFAVSSYKVDGQNSDEKKEMKKEGHSWNKAEIVKYPLEPCTARKALRTELTGWIAAHWSCCWGLIIENQIESKSICLCRNKKKNKMSRSSGSNSFLVFDNSLGWWLSLRIGFNTFPAENPRLLLFLRWRKIKTLLAVVLFCEYCAVVSRRWRWWDD